MSSDGESASGVGVFGDVVDGDDGGLGCLCEFAWELSVPCCDGVVVFGFCSPECEGFGDSVDDDECCIVAVE